MPECQFLLDEVKYLGFKVTKLGVRPTASKVEGVKEAPEPRNTTQLRAFLGLVTYHRQFIPDMATI